MGLDTVQTSPYKTQSSPTVQILIRNEASDIAQASSVHVDLDQTDSAGANVGQRLRRWPTVAPALSSDLKSPGHRLVIPVPSGSGFTHSAIQSISNGRERLWHCPPLASHTTASKKFQLFKSQTPHYVLLPGL